MKSIPIFKVVNGKHKTASVDDRYLHHFTREGWKVEGDAPKENDESVGVDEADMIDGMEDKDSIVKFVEENYGESVDKRGSLETVKEKAKAVINESKRVD